MNYRERVAQLVTPSPEDADLGVSEHDLAVRFTECHSDKLRYVAKWGRWLIWEGTHWAKDESFRVTDMARAICRAETDRLCMLTDSEPRRRRIRERLGSKATIWNVVELAKTDRKHAVTVSQLDADAFALNTPGGVINLETGAIRPHDPAELHTKITAATPGGEAPCFIRLLERVLPDPAVRDYLQRLAGSALVGLVRDHVLPFAYGTGRNGKSTVVHTLRHAMGDYALEIPAETLMESRGDRHPVELAILHGVRLAIGSEVDTGRNWNEARLKGLTGNDPINARYMRSDPFEFQPSHTLVIVGNHKPGLKAVDEAIRSRMHLIPFMVTIPHGEVDTELPEKLRAEAGGILAWMLAGCLDWLDTGLCPPPAITAATTNYLSAEDSIGQWLDECTRKGGQVTLKAAHASYIDWCKSNSSPALGRNTFADQLEYRGHCASVESRNRSKYFEGLELISQRGAGAACAN